MIKYKWANKNLIIVIIPKKVPMNQPSPTSQTSIQPNDKQASRKGSENSVHSEHASLQIITDTESEIKLIVKVQKNIRANLIRLKLKTQFKKIHRRRRIIKQLLDTEQGYIRDLGFIVSDFKMRMRSRGILNDEQCNKIFSNINEIRQLHDVFFSILYNHFENFHPYLIIFKDVLVHIQYFRIYVEYLNNFPYACDYVEEYKKTKPAFALFIAEIVRSPQYRFLSLQDYMVMPIQRLPRYVLLLKELIKNTSSSHPDYKNVKGALQKFQSVNTNNNEKLNKIRNSFKLRELQSMLQLSEGIITPSTQFIMEETVQILSQINNEVLSNCVVYLLNNAIIVTRRCGPLLNRSTLNRNSHSARINRVSGLGNTYTKQKLQTIVPLKHGTSIKFNRDQCFYKNSFTIQAPEGESCTFICITQEQLYNLSTQMQKQIDTIVEQTIIKLKSMFQNQSSIQNNNTFIENIFLLDLVPEVTVLGTSERTDKMLKYTVYIVEVKIKLIKQKIFLRFSELLDLQKFIQQQYGNQFVIKQGLVSSSWLNNHQQKTIEQRKMNIQRFLKQILSKPQIIKNGWRVLLRLGLPVDFYELPKKISENKSAQSFIRKSGAFGKSTVISHFKKGLNRINKNATSYRLSLFQQQKIEQQEEQPSEQEPVQELIKKSFHQQSPLSNIQQTQNQLQSRKINPKSSYGSSQPTQTLCIQDILKANEIDLGHYTRTSQTSDYNQNNPYANRDRFDTTVELEVLVPCLQYLYSLKKTSGHRHEQKYEGFHKIIIKCSKLQRIQNIIPYVAKQINLKYYKDFRLLIEKQYSQRVLDDDQIVHKILGEVNRTKSLLMFRKIIYIDHLIQQKQLINNKERLMLQSSQIINEIKMGKYRLDYESYLKFAVLSAIVYHQYTQEDEPPTQPVLLNYAKQAKYVIFPKYSTLSHTQNVWVEDFLKAFQIITAKLNQINKMNFESLERQRTFHQQTTQNQKSPEVEYQSFLYDNTDSSFWVNSQIKHLAMLSIVKEIEKKQIMYGCVTFSVQISDEFRKFLENEVREEIQVFERKSGQAKSYRKFSQVSGVSNKSLDDSNIESAKKMSEEENRNCWLAIKHNKILFTSITKNKLLLEIQYENISKIQTYSTAIILVVKNININKIKLKTTSSYYIRQMLIYYRNYRSVLKKIYADNQLRQSVIGMAREELGEYPQQDMQQYVL